jgi:hypothetical protein
VGQLFAEKLCSYLCYGNLPLRFGSRELVLSSCSPSPAVGQLFAEKLCSYLCYGNLLLRFGSRDGAHRPMHRGTRYIGYLRNHADAQAAEHSAHDRDRNSAFVAANSSGETMPFCCS